MNDHTEDINTPAPDPAAIDPKKAARDAERSARRAEKEAEKRRKRIADIEDAEKRRQEAIDRERQAREEEQQILGRRKMKVSQRALAAEENKDKQIEQLHNFYKASLTKDNDLYIKIDNLKLIDKLRDIGIYRFDQDNGTSVYVYIHDGKIRLIQDQEKIIDIFEDYVLALPQRSIMLSRSSGEDAIQVEYTITPHMIREVLYSNISAHFQSTLPRLRPVSYHGIQEITTVHDTKTSKYLFYQNCVVRVTADDIEEIAYENLEDRIQEIGEENGQLIWETDILKRNYTPDAGRTGDFWRFATYICGYENETIPAEQSISRMKAFQTMIGYLMHDNYECNLKVALLTDAVCDQGMPSGGTGKGIFGKAMSYMLNSNESDVRYIAVPGKSFDTSKDTRYSMGDLTTQLIHIEDAKKDLDFTALFNDATDNAIFRKLHHDPILHKAKFIISTNHGFDITAPSVRRRICLFELDNFFNDHKTPEDIFGHRFFESEWTDMDWAQFDNFMIDCVQMYMRSGLIEAEEVNYSNNYLGQALRNEFIVWFEAYIHDGYISMTQTEYDLEKMWITFRTIKNGQYSDIFNVRNSFTGAIKKWLRVKRVPSGMIRSTTDKLIIYPDKSQKLSDVIYR